MSRYEKVKFTDGDKTRTVFLRVTRDSDRFLFLVGTEVDKYADDVEGVGFTERTRMIEKSLVLSRRPYILDNHYGWLVPTRRPR